MSEINQTVKDVFRPYIPDDKELDAFGRWAFGEDFLELDQAIKYMECWNYHHGKELLLKPEGSPQIDAPNMIELWKKHKLA